MPPLPPPLPAPCSAELGETRAGARGDASSHDGARGAVADGWEDMSEGRTEYDEREWGVTGEGGHSAAECNRPTGVADASVSGDALAEVKPPVVFQGRLASSGAPARLLPTTPAELSTLCVPASDPERRADSSGVGCCGVYEAEGPEISPELDDLASDVADLTSGGTPKLLVRSRFTLSCSACSGQGQVMGGKRDRVRQRQNNVSFAIVLLEAVLAAGNQHCKRSVIGVKIIEDHSCCCGADYAVADVLARARISNIWADKLHQLLQSMHHVKQLWDLGCA